VSATLHLHSVDNAIPEPYALGKMTPVFLVCQRQNGHWSPGAKIMDIAESEEIAEARASYLKKQHPQQCFGVFVLRSEAREVLNPIEIVRVEGNA
jgi:hypothetical protein